MLGREPQSPYLAQLWQRWPKNIRSCVIQRTDNHRGVLDAVCVATATVHEREGIMTEQPRDAARDETEGHRLRGVSADAEQAEGDDTEGHRWKAQADAEQAEGDDDTEGHKWKAQADAEQAEGDDDTEGHKWMR